MTKRAAGSADDSVLKKPVEQISRLPGQLYRAASCPSAHVGQGFLGLARAVASATRGSSGQ